MSIFSIVTVRRGSKGLRNKCARKIIDKPVFQYVIDYSLQLNFIIKGGIFTVISSDLDLIKKYCFEKKIPFIKRIQVLSSDFTPIEEVIYDAYLKIGRHFDYISLLYGNIPTRYPQEFLKAYNFLKRNRDYNAVISVQNVGKYNPSWMFEFNERILPARRCKVYRRQDLKQYMIHDGHTVLFRTKYFLEFMTEGKLEQKRGLYDAFGKRIKPMINDRVIIDIDSEKDLKLAEAVIIQGNMEGVLK